MSEAERKKLITIANQIQELEDNFIKLHDEYCIKKLKKYVNVDESMWETISNIKIRCPTRCNKYTSIEYKHTTKKYNPSNYFGDEDNEYELVRKTTVEFGDNGNKLFTKSNKLIYIDVNSKSHDIPYITTNEFNEGMSTGELTEKFREWAKNPHMPEWLLLNVLFKLYDSRDTFSTISDMFNLVED